jgi:hypothetical protein
MAGSKNWALWCMSALLLEPIASLSCQLVTSSQQSGYQYATCIFCWGV